MLFRSQVRRAPANISAFTFGPGLDELGISIGGGRSPAAATLDGPIGQEDAADAPGYVAPSGSVGAAQKARATPAEFLSAGDGSPEQTGPPAASLAPRPQNDGRPVHAGAFDASEGTPLDPLRNKTYDLNYAKTVPAIQ